MEDGKERKRMREKERREKSKGERRKERWRERKGKEERGTGRRKGGDRWKRRIGLVGRREREKKEKQSQAGVVEGEEETRMGNRKMKNLKDEGGRRA